MKPATSNVTFLGGTEHGKTWKDVWATQEIVVVVQSAPMESADKLDLKTLLSAAYPKPARQIYALDDAATMTYRLARVEVP